MKKRYVSKRAANILIYVIGALGVILCILCGIAFWLLRVHVMADIFASVL